MKKGSCLFLALLMAFSLLSCSKGREKRAAKKENRSLEPTTTDTLQPLMAKTNSNISYLVYGLVNFDPVKVEKSTTNLAKIYVHVGKNTQFVKAGKGSGDWEAMCEEQKAIALELNQHFQDKDYDQVSVDFGKLIAVCIKCHGPYRRFVSEGH